MSDLRKAAEELLEAFDWDWSEPRNKALRERMRALRQALAMEVFSEVNQEIEEALKQPKWVGLGDEDVATVKNEFNRGALWAEQVLKEKNKREWVGLTDEDLEPMCDDWKIVFGSYVHDFAKAIEAKLKEKNT